VVKQVRSGVTSNRSFGALKGCPWPEFWTGEGNTQAMAAVASAKEGKTAHFRGAADTAKGNPRLNISLNLPRLSPSLGLGIAGDPPESFFNLAANVLGSACDPVLVHGKVLVEGK
jgi:hypothetical protein